LFCWNIAFITLPSQAMNLKIEIEQEEDGRFIAKVIDFPGVLAYGNTRQEAVAKVQALALRVLADKVAHYEVKSDLY
jgi:predicted RNase H-like HicB family nuclease